MTHRERVLAVFHFEQPDRAPYDLMESCIEWPALVDYFREAHGLDDMNQIVNILDTDSRWVMTDYGGPESQAADENGMAEKQAVHTQAISVGPLSGAETIADVESYDWPDPSWWKPGDFSGLRRRWPDHAIVFFPGWKPLFWGACEAFGMEEALTKIVTQPKIFEAYVQRRHEFYMDILRRSLAAGKQQIDICWLGDDYAGQESILISPDMWRKHVKPYLAEQVRLAHENDVLVMLHSCGAIRSILPDLIDIGVNALAVFQTRARGMDAESIASDFGGRLVFYGGIDAQGLLSFGSPEQVRTEVEANVRAFAACGGYVVANSHHGFVGGRVGHNIVAMCEAARNARPQTSLDRSNLL